MAITSSDLIQTVKPWVIKWIQDYGVSGMGGSASVIGTSSIVPTTITLASVNSYTPTALSHAITTSSAPGAAASILATDASGYLSLVRLTTSDRVVTPLITSASGDVTLTPTASVVLTNGKPLIGSGTFVSGFAGSGFRLDYGVSYASQSTMEVDNLIVRGLMRVYELVINRIRVSRGSIIVSPGGGKVKSATLLGGASYSIDFEDAHGLAVNDLIRAQKFTGSGTYQSLGTVTTVTDSDTVEAAFTGSGAPAAGYEYAVMGNTSNSARQGGLFLTADDSGAPFMDIFDGVTAHTDFNTYAKTKVRLGKLTGITDSAFGGTLSGYGLYTSRAYLNGAYINGSLVIGPGIGFSVSPAFYAAYDTPNRSSVANTNGHKGQKATISGGVNGAPTHLGGGISVGVAKTNTIINPSIETNATGYATDSTGGGAVSRSSDFALFGSYSLKFVPGTGTLNCYYTNAGTLSTGGYTFSVYVRRADGAAVAGVTCYIDSTKAGVTPAIIPVEDGWYRLTAFRFFSGAPGNQVVGVYGLASGVTYYFDGWQCENSSDATPYFDGSFINGTSTFAWTGTAHASTSQRGAAQISYSNLGVNPNAGTVMGWYLVDAYNVDGGAGMLWNLGNANTELDCTITSAGALVFRVNGVNATHGTTVSKGRHHIACVWDSAANQHIVYLDGVASSTATPTTTPPTLGTTIDVGCSTIIGATYNCNCTVYDFAVLPSALTANEVNAAYSTGKRLNVARSGYELVLSDPTTAAKVVANAYGIFGTDASRVPTFTLVNVDSTVNGESLTSGDTMLGDNTSGKGNVLFDQSAGALKIRAGTSDVLSFSSAGGIDGVLNIGNGGVGLGTGGATFASPSAAGGTCFKLYKDGTSGRGIIDLWNGTDISVRLDPGDGVIVRTGSTFASDKAINFRTSAGVRTGEIYSYTDGSTYRAMRARAWSDSSSQDAYAYLAGENESSSGKAYSLLWAAKLTAPSTYGFPTAAVQCYTYATTPLAQVLLYVQSKSGSSATATLQDSNGTTSFTVSAGSKSWRIDDPRDPLNKWIDHYTVEGPGYYTYYKGRTTLDTDGRAWVQLPDYFADINQAVEIVFSPKTGAMGVLHLANDGEVIGNTFGFVGGQPGQVVSWIVTGERADPWALVHPARPEIEKSEEERGYLAAYSEHGYGPEYEQPRKRP